MSDTFSFGNSPDRAARAPTQSLETSPEKAHINESPEVMSPRDHSDGYAIVEEVTYHSTLSQGTGGASSASARADRHGSENAHFTATIDPY